MIELFRFALNSIDMGVIIIDSDHRIMFWNSYIEKISQIRNEEADGKPLEAVCETFAKKRYQEIVESVFSRNFSRFCSSKLHHAFIYPKTGYNEKIRQNMTIQPITSEGKNYAVIQIQDITNAVTNEYSLTSLINELKRGYDEIKESEEINKQLAEVDSLTKIANRHAITSCIDKIFANNPLSGGYALLFLDLDGFKHVNDTYGHLMGDNLLIYVADTITNKLRKGDMVARLGGDEFLVLLKNIYNVNEASAVGKKLIEAISRPIKLTGINVQVTASIGISMYTSSIHNTKDFIKTADDAMYRAKRGGKNKFVIY